MVVNSRGDLRLCERGWLERGASSASSSSAALPATKLRTEAGERPKSGVPVVGPPSTERGGIAPGIEGGGGGKAEAKGAELDGPPAVGSPNPKAPRIAERGAFSSV